MARQAELQMTKASWVKVSRLFQQAAERESSVDSPVSLDGKRVPGLQAYQSVQEYLRQDEWSILMQITPLAGRGVW